MRSRPLIPPTPELQANPHKVTRVLIETAGGAVLEFTPTGTDLVDLDVDPDVFRPTGDDIRYWLRDDRPRSVAVQRAAELELRVRTYAHNRADGILYRAYERGRSAVLRPDGTEFTPSGT